MQATIQDDVPGGMTAPPTDSHRCVPFLWREPGYQEGPTGLHRERWHGGDQLIDCRRDGTTLQSDLLTFRANAMGVAIALIRDPSNEMGTRNARFGARVEAMVARPCGTDFTRTPPVDARPPTGKDMPLARFVAHRSLLVFRRTKRHRALHVRAHPRGSQLTTTSSP